MKGRAPPLPLDSEIKNAQCTSAYEGHRNDALLKRVLVIAALSGRDRRNRVQGQPCLHLRVYKAARARE